MPEVLSGTELDARHALITHCSLHHVKTNSIGPKSLIYQANLNNLYQDKFKVTDDYTSLELLVGDHLALGLGFVRKLEFKSGLRYGNGDKKDQKDG